jgi:hypothetical protein
LFYKRVIDVAENIKQPVAENDSRAASSLDSSAGSHWAFINGWKVEPQSNDRAPALGENAAGIVSPSASASRSTARRNHQKKFKEWSQERHD